MSFRPGFRAFNAFRANFTQYTARRHASTAPGAEAPAGFAKFWNSPIGPKTVHFWYALPLHNPALQCLFGRSALPCPTLPYLSPATGSTLTPQPPNTYTIS